MTPFATRPSSEPDREGPVGRELEPERGQRKESERPGEGPADDGGAGRRSGVSENRGCRGENGSGNEQGERSLSTPPRPHRDGDGSHERKSECHPAEPREVGPERCEQAGDRLKVPRRVAVEMDPVVAGQQRHSVRRRCERGERNQEAERDEGSQARHPELTPPPLPRAGCNRNRSRPS